MAENINEQLEDIGFVNLGVKARPNLVVLKRTKMPAVLVEVGFVNSDVDNKLFDENFEEIAQAIAYGILDTLETDHEIESPGYEVQVGAYPERAVCTELVRRTFRTGFSCTHCGRRPSVPRESGELCHVGRCSTNGTTFETGRISHSDRQYLNNQIKTIDQ